MDNGASNDMDDNGASNDMGNGASNHHRSAETGVVDLVRVIRDGAVATVTMCSPGRYNALSAAMLDSLTGAFDALSCDSAVRVVVLAAEGKAFSAGHDLREMRGMPEVRERDDHDGHRSHDADRNDADRNDVQHHRALFDRCTRMMMSVRRLPQPVIARVQGLATAAGCQLVAMCDLAVAAQSARFAVSGINLGLFCATPAVPLSRCVSTKSAFEMLVTGDFIDAHRARDLGLVNRVVPEESLDEEVDALAAQIASKDALALSMGKRLFYEQREMGIEAAYQLAAQTMACNLIDGSARQGIEAFLQRRRRSSGGGSAPTGGCL